MNAFAPTAKLAGDLRDTRINRYLILSTLIALVTLGPLLSWLGFAAYDWLNGWLEGIRDEPWAKHAFITGALLGVAKVLIGFALTVGLGLGFLSLFAILTLGILGFFTDSIVKAVRDKHFPAVALDGNSSMLTLGWQMARGVGLHLLWLPVLVPLLLIPAINGPSLMLWLHSMFRFTLILDVASVVWPKERVGQKAPVFGTRWFAPTGLCYLGALVPILNLVMPFTAVVWMAHLMLAEKQAYDAKALPTTSPKSGDKLPSAKASS